MSLPLYRHSLRRKDLDELLNSVLQDKLVTGELVDVLGRNLCSAFAWERCALLASPSLAVRMILRDLNVGRGDAVMLSPLAPAYWSEGLAELGVELVWCDVTARSPVLTAGAMPTPLPERLKAVVVDTCLGFHPDYAALDALGLVRIHDVSQGLGGRFEGRGIAHWGDVVFIHFGAESVLAGSGGCAVGLRRGFLGEGDAWTVAPWDRLSDVSASLLLSQWPDLPDLAEGKVEAFRALFLRLAKGFSQPRQDGADLPVCPVFPVLVESGAKEILAHARKHSVEADWAFREHSVRIPAQALDQCPNARYFVQHTLAFPLYSRFSAKEIESLGKVLASLP